MTEKIIERGATVVGIDNSLSMVAAAKARGLDARLMDAADLRFSEAFDAAFSNATLHWVLDKERAARAIWALKFGGRFAGEMGGDGNLAALREALDDVLVPRGFGPPTFAANWYPGVEDFVAVYEQAGFKDVDARLIERPTPLEHGVAAWVTTFRRGWLDRAEVPGGGARGHRRRRCGPRRLQRCRLCPPPLHHEEAMIQIVIPAKAGVALHFKIASRSGTPAFAVMAELS